MKSNLMKFFAIMLAAVMLTLAVLSGIGLIFLLEQDLYPAASGQESNKFLDAMTYRVAYNYALKQFAESEGMTENEIQLLRQDRQHVPYYISDMVLEVCPTGSAPSYGAGAQSFNHTVTDLLYPLALEYGEEAPNTDALPVKSDIRELYTQESGWKEYTLLYYQAAPIVVTVVLSTTTSPTLQLTEFIYGLRHFLPAMTIGGAILGLACLVYLCWAAGKKKGRDEIRPGGLNRMPLDVYAALVLILLCLGIYLMIERLLPGFYGSYSTLMAALSAVATFLLWLPVVGWVFAFAAQVKVKGYWWRHSAIGWCLLKIVHGIGRCWQGLRAVFRLLPVIWQWLLTAAGMVLVFCFTFYGAFMADGYIRANAFFVLLLLGVTVFCGAIVLYGGYCFGTILEAVKEMAAGNLDRKVNTRNLIAVFRDCGDNLNALSDAAMEAARQQMKSERMKTELIANVSHDIKTPLTSIINYVDLLQKPHSEEENTQYMEVLSRQSLRLKKLTEDLIEMSKATTGNIAAEPAKVDACEAIRQALGEFSDKLDAAELHVVLRQPDEPVMMRADGRLTWRVLSNLLGNAVKYAMPGTRLYADVVQNGDRVLLSLKNMSREQLNISADELMERFVRGDVSRHAEGSGLGLSIAKGLMEAQNGTLQLLTDGDLFKVTLDFPADNA